MFQFCKAYDDGFSNLLSEHCRSGQAHVQRRTGEKISEAIKPAPVCTIVNMIGYEQKELLKLIPGGRPHSKPDLIIIILWISDFLNLFRSLKNVCKQIELIFF